MRNKQILKFAYVDLVFKSVKGHFFKEVAKWGKCPKNLFFFAEMAFIYVGTKYIEHFGAP